MANDSEPASGIHKLALHYLLKDGVDRPPIQTNEQAYSASKKWKQDFLNIL